MGAILSAKKTFFKKPIDINVMPNLRFVELIENCFNLYLDFISEIFSFNCGKKSLARKIGPAIKVGKNDTNNPYCKIELVGFNEPRYMSII